MENAIAILVISGMTILLPVIYNVDNMKHHMITRTVSVNQDMSDPMEYVDSVLNMHHLKMENVYVKLIINGKIKDLYVLL